MEIGQIFYNNIFLVKKTFQVEIWKIFGDMFFPFVSQFQALAVNLRKGILGS